MHCKTTLDKIGHFSIESTKNQLKISEKSAYLEIFGKIGMYVIQLSQNVLD